VRVCIALCSALLVLQGCANKGVKPSESSPVVARIESGRAGPLASPGAPAPVEPSYIDDPRLDPIRDKVPLTLRGDAVNAAQLRNGRRPAAIEKEAIKTWQTLRLADHQRARERRGPPSPRLQTTRLLLTRAITQLYAGHLTYAQFARQVVDIDAQHRGVALKSED